MKKSSPVLDIIKKSDLHLAADNSIFYDVSKQAKRLEKSILKFFGEIIGEDLLEALLSDRPENGRQPVATRRW